MAVKTRRYSARDVTILVIGLGMAVIVNVGLIWGPTVASAALSGTDWNGIGPIEW
ncbi:MAG: sugar ABC transporter permease, partial [Nonomuraea sp.]|nr:sugar ABC transporter permease [Nonomuraea sp.]